MLENASADVRFEAAINLCELGDRRGVPELMKQAESRSWPYSALNAARNPVAWKTLGSVKTIGVNSGVRRLMIERFGSIAGLPIRWEGLDTFDRKAWSNESIENRYTRDYDTGREKWERLLDSMRDGVCGRARRSDTKWSYILESDSIRVLPAADALAFWKKWWEEEQAKKK